MVCSMGQAQPKHLLGHRGHLIETLAQTPILVQVKRRRQCLTVPWMLVPKATTSSANFIFPYLWESMGRAHQRKDTLLVWVSCVGLPELSPSAQGARWLEAVR